MLFDLGYKAHGYQLNRPGFRGCSLQEFFARFPTEDSCWSHLISSRYDEVITCERCGYQDSRLRPQKVYEYYLACRHSIAPKSDIVFHRTQISLQLWFYLFLLLANSNESLSADFITKHLGIHYNSAQRMLRRARLHLAALSIDEKCSNMGDVLLRIVPIRNVIRTRPHLKPLWVLSMTDHSIVKSVALPSLRGKYLDAAISLKVESGANL